MSVSPPKKGKLRRSRPARIARRMARKLWQARRSAVPGVRAAWWLTLAAVVALALAGERRPALFWLLWILLNGGLALTCGLWGLFHPRRVLQASRVIGGFGILMSLLTVLMLFALQDFITSHVPSLSLSASVLLLGGVLVVAPLALLLCLLGGYLGASIGIFGRRNRADSAHRARYGVCGWWLAAWLGGTVMAQRPTPAGNTLALIVWSGAPLLSLLAAQAVPFLRLNNVGLVHRLAVFLDAKLRRKARWRKRPLDLRGYFLGGLAGLGVLACGLAGMLYPLQARLLAVLVEFRSAPLVAAQPTEIVETLFNEDSVRAQARRFVVLRMDGATKRRILQSGSETATQAQLIEKLAGYGCRMIVLPTPLLDLAWRQNNRATPETPLPDAQAVARNRRDLPRLTRAVQRAENVLLSVPNITLHGFDEEGPVVRAIDASSAEVREVNALARAAFRVGAASLDHLEVARLPAMTLRWQALQPREDGLTLLPPLPIVLAAAMRGAVLPESLESARALSFTLGAERLPVTSPGQILVSYFAGEPGVAFPAISYQTALQGDALALRTAQPPSPPPAPGQARELRVRIGRGGSRAAVTPPPTAPPTGWVRPEAYFRDKIVFLDSLDARSRLTPIGSLDEPELLAHASTTLLTGSILHRLFGLPLQQTLLTTLLLAALVGQLTIRRPPLQAGWRVALLTLAYVVLCLALLLLARLWVDMLIPLLASGLAFLLVVQFNTALDRWQVSRNRELLERFMEKELVADLLDKGDTLELGGKRREVTVLFADVRGFSRFASRHEPEEVIATLNEYLTMMTDQVFRYNGLLDKYLGDGLLALFGVPEPRGDDAQRAVQAAVGIQQGAARLSAALRAQGREPLSLGIGLHVGEAVFGLVGHIRRMDLTAIGHTVVVGQRLQTTAQPGEIVLSEAMIEKVKHLVEAQERPPVPVKGLVEPVRPYLLLATPLADDSPPFQQTPPAPETAQAALPPEEKIERTTG